MPSGRAVRPEATSSVGPIAIHYWASLRPCLGTAIAPRRRARFRQALLGAGGARQGKRDARAAAEAVLGPDRPAVRLHEPLRDGEAETGAAARPRPRVVRPPEALEHPLGGPGREAVPVVLDRDDHAIGVRLDHDR